MKKKLSKFFYTIFFLFLSLPRFLGFPRMDFREWISAVGVFFFFLVFVFPTGCVRVNSSVGDGLGGFRLPPTYGCSLSQSFESLPAPAPTRLNRWRKCPTSCLNPLSSSSPCIWKTHKLWHVFFLQLLDQHLSIATLEPGRLQTNY